MKNVLLITGMLLLMTIEILRVYFIMPFPHSQSAGQINFAYFINRNIWWLRVLALLFTAIPLLLSMLKARWLQKTVLLLAGLAYAAVFYYFNFRLAADNIFPQMGEKRFYAAQINWYTKNQQVVCICVNNQAKAYPTIVLAYHHIINDTVGGMPVVVTYCSLCHTARVYSPFLNGQRIQFRLMGINNSNALFEDERTNSWWQQATGQAITGTLKGARLTEIPCLQMTLTDWAHKYPGTLLMQPDKNYMQQYAAFYNGQYAVF